MIKILFVCTGNTCRSSMAEVLAQHIIAQNGWQQRLQVVSAGVAASEGLPASTHAVTAMDELGVDLSGHRSRMVNEQLLLEADYILTMTKQHKFLLNSVVPGDKLYTLGEFAGKSEEDILDPFGGSLDAYRRCAAQLRELVAKALEEIVERN